MTPSYAITLDRVPEALYPVILANDAQRREWVRLFALDELTDLREHPFLVLETRFFGDDFTSALLASLGDWERALDGVLIHGENAQVLRHIAPRFRGRIDLIAIDPPFNTSDEDFVYKNSYSRSAWVEMMRERVTLGRELLTERGVFLCAIDDTETAALRLLLDDVFGRENYVTTIVAEVNPAGQNLRPGVPARSHEYCHVYARDAARVRVRPRPLTRDEAAAYTEADERGRFLWDNLRRRGGNSRPVDRPNQWYPLHVDLKSRRVSCEALPGWQEVWPIDPRGEQRIWRVTPTTAQREIEAGEIGVLMRAGRVEIVKKTRQPEGKKPKTLWKDPRHSATTHGTKLLDNIVATNVFTYPKSVYYVRDLLDAWAGPEAMILDFFAGSGTTAHAVMMLNREDGGRRKYLLVEQGDYFDSVLKTRVLRTIYSPEWRRWKPTRREGGLSQFVEILS